MLNSKFAQLIIMLSVVYMAGCATTPQTTIRVHEDFEKGKYPYETVALLPVDVVIRENSMEGSEGRMKEKEELIYDQIIDALVPTLAHKGYKVKANPIIDAIDENTELGYDYNNFKTAMVEVAAGAGLGARVELEKKQHTDISVGEVASPLADFSNADLLAFVTYSGFENSTGLQVGRAVGKAILTVLAGGNQIQEEIAAGGSLTFILVDGSSGDVLWSNAQGYNVGQSFLSKIEPSNLVTDTLRSMPVASPYRGKVAKSPPLNEGVKLNISYGKEFDETVVACEIDSKLDAAFKGVEQNNFYNVATETDYNLEVSITAMNKGMNAFIDNGRAGKPYVEVRGILYNNDEIVGTFTGKERASGFGGFLSECGRLESTLDALVKDVSSWLLKPSFDSYL